ncbi:uncharacterized protein PRCAT00000322001 [Priceomyces carsonii]|uniref:uncharacterized protein n=1 Tax=Priceomyces carsonii TaxID=28549 RepID=UPI002EDB4DA4|nr:unnamed protein product [Priceomyces carsonii]
MSSQLVNQVELILPHIPLTLISQGAEALVFETNVHPYISEPYLSNKRKFVIKYRPPKEYRHPKIDAAITKNRTIGEVRFMHKLTKLNIGSPSLILVDFVHGLIWMEYLGHALENSEPSSFKNWLWYLEQNFDSEKCIGLEAETTCKEVGKLIGKLHLNDMIHGDLTSSNIMLTRTEPCLIDFGLSSYSGLPEDKAVDLYVLERAILSTHSRFASEYNAWLLEGYESIHKDKKYQKFGVKKLNETLNRLHDVRLRGRKRSMIG